MGPTLNIVADPFRAIIKTSWVVVIGSYTRRQQPSKVIVLSDSSYSDYLTYRAPLTFRRSRE